MKLKIDELIEDQIIYPPEGQEEPVPEEKPKKKWRLSALDIYVIFSITALIVYTIFAHYMVIEYGASLDVLTTCFFAFFGGEIVTCALIKIFKLKEPKQNGGDISG